MILKGPALCEWRSEYETVKRHSARSSENNQRSGAPRAMQPPKNLPKVSVRQIDARLGAKHWINEETGTIEVRGVIDGTARVAGAV